MTVKQNHFNPDKVALLSDKHPDPFFGPYQPFLDVIPQDTHKRLKETVKIAKAEAIDSTLRQKILLGSIALWTVIEWGPFWDSILGNVGVDTHKAIAGGNIGLGNIKVGVITGAVTGGGQAIAGLLASGGIKTFPEALKHWNDTKKNKPPEQDEITLLSDKYPDPFSGPYSLFPPKTLRAHKQPKQKKEQGSFVTALFLGTAVAVVEKNARNPERTFGKDATMTLGYAAIIATINSVLITGASIGVSELEKAGYTGTASFVESIIKNPLTYLTIFAAINEYRETKKDKKLHNSYPIID